MQIYLTSITVFHLHCFPHLLSTSIWSSFLPAFPFASLRFFFETPCVYPPRRNTVTRPLSAPESLRSISALTVFRGQIWIPGCRRVLWRLKVETNLFFYGGSQTSLWVRQRKFERSRSDSCAIAWLAQIFLPTLGGVKCSLMSELGTPHLHWIATTALGLHRLSAADWRVRKMFCYIFISHTCPFSFINDGSNIQLLASEAYETNLGIGFSTAFFGNFWNAAVLSCTAICEQVPFQ